MTAKEMFKKVENYNKLGEELNREKIEVVFDYYITETAHTESVFKTFKEWRKQIKKEYHEFAFKALCEFDGYKFNEIAHVPVTYFEGTPNEQKDTIEVVFKA